MLWGDKMKNPLYFKKVNPIGVVVKNLEEALASYSKGIEMESKGAIHVIPEGTISHKIAGRGEGYGGPLERPVEEALKDIGNGFVYLEKAQEDHGIWILSCLRGMKKRHRKNQLKLVGHTSKYQICLIGLVLKSPCKERSITSGTGRSKLVIVQLSIIKFKSFISIAS